MSVILDQELKWPSLLIGIGWPNNAKSNDDNEIYLKLKNLVSFELNFKFILPIGPFLCLAIINSIK